MNDLIFGYGAKLISFPFLESVLSSSLQEYVVSHFRPVCTVQAAERWNPFLQCNSQVQQWQNPEAFSQAAVYGNQK